MAETQVVYRDERYTLGQQDGITYLIAGGIRLTLTCSPFEPCLYISDGYGMQVSVHSSFDPAAVMECFLNSRTVTSITGLEYDAKDFCRMVEYACGAGDISIDEAEKVFAGRADKKHTCTDSKRKKKDCPDSDQTPSDPDSIIYDDPFYLIIDEYPDTEVDFCLVRNDRSDNGPGAHRRALACACRHMFFDGKEKIWKYDCGAAEGRRIAVCDLFSVPEKERGENYRGAFMYPPHGARYSDADFDRVNAALFPCGTEHIEVYEWTTDWSEYFDEGHEWWGALCYTVYDGCSDRFTVIMASATD